MEADPKLVRCGVVFLQQLPPGGRIREEEWRLAADTQKISVDERG